MSLFLLILLGLFVGVVTGITGASGVLIMVPIFSTFFDVPLPVVLGTSLLVDVIASLSVSYAYARAKNLDFKSVVWILVGALVGAQIGSYFVVSVSHGFIMLVLSVCMIVFGIKMWKNGKPKDNNHKKLVVSDKVSNYFKTPIGMLICGLVIGLTTGIFGAGGGLTVFIILYSLLKFPIKKAIGTSVFVMFVAAFSGVIGYFENGNFDLKLGLIIGISAAVGGALSSIFANRIREEILARLIAGFFIFSALIMLVLKVIMPFIELYL